jgi:hypothetical protein
MAKLAIIFIAVFLCIQLAICDTVVDDAPEIETTTKNGFDKLKDHVDNLFNQENLDKAKEGFNNLTKSASVIIHSYFKKSAPVSIFFYFNRILEEN